MIKTSNWYALKPSLISISEITLKSSHVRHAIPCYSFTSRVNEIVFISLVSSDGVEGANIAEPA
jgi:hypothetical protein